jgi:hypothetical protein
LSIHATSISDLGAFHAIKIFMCHTLAYVLKISSSHTYSPTLHIISKERQAGIISYLAKDKLPRYKQQVIRLVGKIRAGKGQGKEATIIKSWQSSKNMGM